MGIVIAIVITFVVGLCAGSWCKNRVVPVAAFGLWPFLNLALWFLNRFQKIRVGYLPSCVTVAQPGLGLYLLRPIG